MHFQNLMEIKFCWRQIFENLLINECSVVSQDVTQHLVPISSAILTFIGHKQTKKRPPRQEMYILIRKLVYKKTEFLQGSYYH